MGRGWGLLSLGWWWGKKSIRWKAWKRRCGISLALESSCLWFGFCSVGNQAQSDTAEEFLGAQRTSRWRTLKGTTLTGICSPSRILANPNLFGGRKEWFLFGLPDKCDISKDPYLMPEEGSVAPTYKLSIKKPKCKKIHRTMQLQYTSIHILYFKICLRILQ